jgi:hypothetical protein
MAIGARVMSFLPMSVDLASERLTVLSRPELSDGHTP